VVKIGFEIKRFETFFRIPNRKINATKFFVSLENLNDYGIEKFYGDVQRILEIRFNNLCYLKIGRKEIIKDRCNFTTRPQGKAVKTKRKTRNTIEFVDKWGYHDTDTSIFK